MARSWTSSGATSTSATTSGLGVRRVRRRPARRGPLGRASRTAGPAGRSSATRRRSSSRARRGSWPSAPTSSSRRAGSTSTAPIARYWPEFAQAGKERDHRARGDGPSRRPVLPRHATSRSRTSMAWDPVIRAIEIQRPHSRPDDGPRVPRRRRSAGWSGEVIRRITGLSRRDRTSARRLAIRSGSHTWIGLPASERAQVAWMEPPLPDEDSEMAPGLRGPGRRAPPRPRDDAGQGASPSRPPTATVTFNDPGIQAAEIPGAGGISAAASLATPVRGVRDRGRWPRPS